ncbi:formimidoylglutamate deiminase [Phreatobacter stygius]|uniref:Formimidoylglutamate deiminase n=1 Tax=Phreatobacter stygius TaxID=1940610 RepID=A0A4D7B4A6_9HYPH|nr:formimidoylglutamate deiminase [Phreatobacter stygius]QCI64880.1 formimidoylglutamate deiminase [Phreatobacter stygius]
MDKLHLDKALTPAGWRDDLTLTIASDGRISAIAQGPAPSGVARLKGATLPGLPNLHSHAFQRGMAGLTEVAGTGDDSFWTWRDWMYRFVGALDPDDVEAIAALAYVEMVEAGYTTVGEFHYLHNDKDGRAYADPAELSRRHVAAAGETGIAITLLPVFYAHAGFGGTPPSEGQRRFITGLDGFARLAEGASVAAKAYARGHFGIAPHSLRAVTEDELTRLIGLFPEGPVHIHVSEQVKEVEDCLAFHGRRPIELLGETVALSERWCLIHATHADAGERAAMAKAGVVVGLCPITEANLGDGLFDGVDFVGQGGRFGIGTDSNVAISALAELAMLEYAQRFGSRRRNALAPRGASTGRTLFDACLAGGGQALGLGPQGISVGAPADLVVLDTGGIAFAARTGDAILDSWVFGPSRDAISEVYVSGRRVVDGGRHVKRPAIEARARKVLERVIGA